MNGLAGDTSFFDRSIEFAIEIEPGDLLLRSMEQSVVFCGIHRTDGWSG